METQLSLALCGFWVKSRAKNKSTVPLLGVWKRPPVRTHSHTHIYKYTLKVNWGAPVAEAQAEALSCSFLTHAYITHTCRGEAEMCFDTDDGRWEVYNESRAAQPQCYLFHYLNNGPGTARWMLLLDRNVTFQTLYFSGIKNSILLLCTGIFFGPVSLRNKWQAWGVGWWIRARV